MFMERGDGDGDRKCLMRAQEAQILLGDLVLCLLNGHHCPYVLSMINYCTLYFWVSFLINVLDKLCDGGDLSIDRDDVGIGFLDAVEFLLWVSDGFDVGHVDHELGVVEEIGLRCGREFLLLNRF